MEEYVGRKEFDILKQEVNEIKKDLDESQKILCSIERKIDVISEKILSNDKVEELKLQPIKDRVAKLEDNQSWLRKSIYGGIITIVIEAIIYFIKFVK